jgi:hypothetical protein
MLQTSVPGNTVRTSSLRLLANPQFRRYEAGYLQIVVRYFGNTNRINQQGGTIEANGCGKFADITDTALQALKDIGLTHVWLTGCCGRHPNGLP